MLLNRSLFCGFGQLKVFVFVLCSCSLQQWPLLVKNWNNQQGRGLRERERNDLKKHVARLHCWHFHFVCDSREESGLSACSECTKDSTHPHALPSLQSEEIQVPECSGVSPGCHFWSISTSPHSSPAVVLNSFCLEYSPRRHHSPCLNICVLVVSVNVYN